MLEEKNVFDVLYERIELDLRNSNIKDVKTGIRSFEKMMNLYEEWKTSKVVSEGILHKLLELIKTDYIIKNIDIRDLRTILELNEIASLLMDLITVIDKKLNHIKGIVIVGGKITNANDNKALDMIKYSWNNGILIALTDENKHRGIGKTTELIKFAHEKDVSLIVPTHQAKKYADGIAKNLGISVHIQYTGNSLNGIRCKNNKFIVDEGVPREVIVDLVKGGNELMGGFTSHYVKQFNLDNRNNDVFIKPNYYFNVGTNSKVQLNIRELEYPIRSGNFTELMTVHFNHNSMVLTASAVINVMKNSLEPRSFTVDFKECSLKEVADFILKFILLFNVQHFYMSKNGIELGIWDYLTPLFEGQSIQYNEENRLIIRDVNNK